MKTYLVTLDETVSTFYERIAKNVNLPVERVLADALFKMAGELSQRAITEKEARR